MKSGVNIVLSLINFSLCFEAYAQSKPLLDFSASRTQVSQVGSQRAEKSLGIEALLASANRIIVDSDASSLEDARNQLIQITRQYPSDPRGFGELARFDLWQIAGGKKDHQEISQVIALAQHASLLSDKIHSSYGGLVLVETLLALGQLNMAQGLFQGILKTYGPTRDVKIFQARFLATSKPRLALESAQESIAMGASIDELSPSIIAALLKLETHHSRAEVFWNFNKVYPDRWVAYRAGLFFMEEARFDEAKRAFQKSMDLGNLLEAPLQLATLLYRVEKNFAASKKIYLDLIAHVKSKNASFSPVVAMSYGHLSIISAQEKDILQSKMYAAELIGEAANQTDFITHFFDLYLGMVPIRELESVFVSLMDTHPTMSFVHLSLGRIYSSKKDFETALNYLRSAQVLQPQSVEITSAYAHVLYQLKDYEKALAGFEKAIVLQPDLGNHHYNRACVLALLGRKNEAMESLEKAVVLNHTLIETAQKDSDFALLKEDNSFVAKWVDLKDKWQSPTDESLSQDLESSAVPSAR